jgi:pimeloyl-ACP methyl ester carboxylesterase
MGRRDRFVEVDGVELHYSEWGDADAPPLVCVHGLSRVGRDFDPLAERIADDYRVICPDMPGRGLSEWADGDDQAEEWYTAEFMAGLITGFYDELGLESTRYAGISMGGMLGVGLAAGPLADRISHLLMVDVGPGPAEDESADEGIQRIIDYLTNPPRFDRLTDLETYFQDVYDTFSPMDDDEWRRLTLTSARRGDEGHWLPNYDPRIVEPLLMADDGDAWDAWDALDCETFVVKGEHSDILSDATFAEMVERKPDTGTLEVEGCGHVPALNVPEQVDPVRAFLEA